MQLNMDTTAEYHTPILIMHYTCNLCFVQYYRQLYLFHTERYDSSGVHSDSDSIADLYFKKWSSMKAMTAPRLPRPFCRARNKRILVKNGNGTMFICPNSIAKTNVGI